MLLAKALSLANHTIFRRLGQVQEAAGLTLEQMGEAVEQHVSGVWEQGG